LCYLEEKAIQFNDFNLWLGLNGSWVHILKDITFTVPKGKILGIVGASGSGKSMILKSMLQLFEGIPQVKQEGGIFISGENAGPVDILSTSSKTLRELRKNSFGLVFQLSSEVLNPSQNIFAQLSERLDDETHTKSQLYNKCVEYLTLVGINDPELTLQKYPHQLSGGQVQRVLIAIGIIHEPSILLVDEPTSALNSKLKKEVLDLIKKLNDSLNLSIILVSHNLKLTSEFSDYLVVVDKGSIVESGKCFDIISNPRHLKSQELLGHNITKIDRFERTSNDESILQLLNIEHAFTTSNGFLRKKRQVILFDFNLDIKKAEIVGLVGESGSGKSTVGRIISGLLLPNKGQILFRGKNISKLTNSEYKEFRSKVQIIFQDPLSSLSPHRNGKQVIMEALDILNMKYDKHSVIEMFNAVALDPSILEKTPKQMSGGQRQRLLIARALLYQPELLICDEILSSLDTIVKKKIIIMLKQLSLMNKMAILFISHDLKVIEEVSDRIVLIN